MMFYRHLIVELLGLVLALTTVTARATGAEPFWRLEVNSASSRFAALDDPMRVRSPSLASTMVVNAPRWIDESQRAATDARVRSSECGDGMPDRDSTHKAVTRIGGLVHQGCVGVTAGTALSPNPIGKWVVVDHHVPGISAMTHAEAAQWHGRVIHLGTKEATSGMDTCQQPVYRYHTALANHLLFDKFHFAPSDLGLHAKAQLGLTEVLCGNTTWPAIGGFLIWADEDRPYTVWDGVFFELRRLTGEFK